MEAVHAATLAGMGIAVLPLYIASDALRLGRLVQVLRDCELASESAIHIVYLPDRNLPSRVRALVEFLLARFVSPPWEEPAR